MPKPLAPPGLPILALALLVVVASGIVGVAYRYYESQKEAIEQEVRNQLLSIADLKVREISDWREQRMDEVRLLMADTASLRAIERLTSGAPGKPELAEVRTWLEEVCRRFHYAGATVVDGRGNPVLSVGRFFGDSQHLQRTAAEVLSTNEIVFHDLHFAASSGVVHMGLNLPLRASPNGPLFGALLLGIDPAERLYPMLQRWPVASRSGETLLARRAGEEALFLNDPRFRQGAALQLRIPLSRRDNPAVRAVLGAQGVVEGADYRGVPVFAAVRPVPDLPWFLVAKMDTEDVEAPIRRRSILLLAATVSLILAAGAGVFAIWRRQQLQFYRARYEADLERQALMGHYDYLSRFANDIILMVDERGRILEANDRAVAAYGYSREELRGKTVRDLRHPSSMEDFERQWKEIGERGSLVFECVHQTRDGNPFPVEVSARFIQVGLGRFRQAIIRDITERKALDEKLRRMLDAHSAVIESSAAGIVSVTPDFRVSTWNKAAERIFGWTAEEAVGQTPLFIPPHRLESARRLHHSTIEGGVVSGYSGFGQCKDGRVITVSISAAPLHDPDGQSTGTVLSFLDTTDQTRAEEALRRNESLYRATFEQAAVGMNYVSLDGRFLRVNPRYCEITGYSQEELLQLRFQDITYPGDAAQDRRSERLLGGEAATIGYNKRYLRKDGSVVWAHLTVSLLRSDSGEPLHFVAVVDDITERIGAEEALRQSEERFRRLVESAPEGIVVERDRRILYMNSAAVRLFGARSAAELLGRDVVELASPEDRAAVKERSETLGRHMGVPPVERTYLRVDGTPFPVEVFAEPIDYDQQPAALVFMRDITERKQTEAEKRRLEEQLLQAQKMESLGRLAGGVAHDFNNHLTVITGYCDMLLMSMEPGDGRREEVEEIRAAGVRAGTLTQQLLAFSRKQIAERKPVNLNEVVAESGKMLRRLIGEDVEIVITLDPALGLVVADHGQMSQILMNLTINARDAMPSGGTIHIETSNVELDRDAPRLHKDAAPGPYAVLSVADTGMGMSPETVQHIFEPFFTTKGMGIGTGLGLSTVYGTAQQSGGWVDVDSRLGEGSRFRIYLPRVRQAAAVRERPPAPVEAPGGAETVLVAEDQPEVRRLALRILQSNGYCLLEASNGPEALALSRGYKGRIDLLVTDVIMPEMTGRELADRLRESRPQIQVLYVSGYTADVIGREGLLDAGVAYLPKPFTPAQLSLKVREVLGQSKTAGKILVLDGDSAVRGIVEQALSEAGYEVLLAGDGREGRRLAAEQTFDLVLADPATAGPEGAETIGELRRGNPDIRIVAMSGMENGVPLPSAESWGADATIRKPVDCQELLRNIRLLI